MLQMKKSPIKFKLDYELCYIAKNHAIKIELLERLRDNNRKKNIKLEDDNDLGL